MLLVQPGCELGPHNLALITTTTIPDTAYPYYMYSKPIVTIKSVDNKFLHCFSVEILYQKKFSVHQQKCQIDAVVFVDMFDDG